MSEQKKHIVIKILKYIGWSLFTLTLLLVAARYSLKTAWVHSFAKNKVVSIANQNLNGSLYIDRISGDLWNDFKIYGLEVIQTDTAVSLDSTQIKYNIWALLNSQFSASEISASGLRIKLSETENGTFNVQKILRSEASDEPEESTSTFGIDIQDLLINESSIHVNSPSYLPDSTLSIEQLSALGGISFGTELSASISSLSFKLKEGRLPEPVSFSTSATYDDQTISLNELVIETGRSLIQANGFTDLSDSSLTAQATTMPFSLRDIQPYLDYDLPSEYLQLSLDIAGNFDDLKIELKGEGNGFDDLLLVSNVSFSETPTLTKFGLSGQNLDLGYFTNDSTDAEIGDFQLSLEGKLNQQPDSLDITWGFTLNDIRYEDYIFEILFGSGTVINDNLLANIQLSDGSDTIVLNTDVESLFSDYPGWSVDARVSDIDLGWWTKNPELSGNIHFRALAEGKGFQLSNEPWTFSIYPNSSVKGVTRIPDSTGAKMPQLKPIIAKDTMIIADQPFSDFDLKGTISKDSAKADGFLQLIDDRINFSASFAGLFSEAPSFNYQIETKNFDLNEITSVDDIPSSINARIQGEGRYFDPEKIQLNTAFLIDSSYVNGADFELMDINANLDGNILTVQNGELISEVIEGSFSGRRNLTDQTDPDNNFALDMQVKNLQPLASFVGAEILNASGNISGNVTEIIENELLFDGNVKLNEVKYDTLFSANTIEGTTKISIRDVYGYDFSLRIDQPLISGIALQDVEFSATGISTTDSLSGNFNLDVISDEDGEISQAGEYYINLETLSTSITWNMFDFRTPARVLSLQAPFNLNYRDYSINTDTLMLSSVGGTFLNMAIPYADSTQQELWIEGEEFDFGVMQDILFNERFVDGILSGNFKVDRSPTELTGNGVLDIKNLTYQGTVLDRFYLNFNLISERLNANITATIDGQEALTGEIDIPFIPEAPEQLDDTFFAEPISGSLVINPVELSTFENLLRSFQVTGTRGILSFNGSLKGTAGNPDFEGRFNLEDPTLSGIKIDSAFASFKYLHNEERITGITEINARGQKAASINAEIPIAMNFRTFELIMPDEDDVLSFNLTTSDFNLSVFNDFLNKDYMNRLRGTLNANVNISGTKNNLAPQGSLQLTGGEVAVPFAGINLTRINSELGFSENGDLVLRNLNMNSGSGNFSANGSIELEGITPTNLDLSANATRFRLANTSDYNLTIDLDSKLTGQPTRPEASGILTIKNGFVYLQDFGERSVETVELEGEEVSSFSPYDSLKIDMRFVIERDFLVRNQRYLDMEIELTGELDAQKDTGDDLQLFGTLNAERGYVRPLGKQFNLEEGRFTFSGPLTEPDLYINTSYIPQSSQKQGEPIILYYIIEGNAMDPEFRFESDPQMEQQDIICYTLFNKPCYALESWQQVVSGGTGSSPSDLLVGVLLDEFEALATQELGIDVVQIENTRSGNNSGTSIKTGWYLNRKTFFAIVNEISGTTPKTMFILEYMLNQYLDLIITQGDDNRQGIDLRWQYDY